MTDKNTMLQRVYEGVPQEQAQRIIQAAANVSQKPAADITLHEAMEILQGDNPNPLLNDYLNKIAEDCGNMLMEGISDEDFEQLQELAENCDYKELYSIMIPKFESVILQLIGKAADNDR